MMEKALNDLPADAAGNMSISVQGLKGRQSVRATFRLPEKTIQLLALMARQLGLQQKSLFDQLMEDSSVLQQVAASVPSASALSGRTRQKTFVLSKRSLEILDRVSRRQNIPRDLLVEISILRLLPVMSAEQDKHRKRLLLHNKMKSLRKQLVKLAADTEQQLGSEDQASMLVRDVSDVLEENLCELEAILEKGQAIEQYEKLREHG